MRRRKPDTIEVQQMKSKAREEKQERQEYQNKIVQARKRTEQHE